MIFLAETRRTQRLPRGTTYETARFTRELREGEEK
jgi:hypothetical protein